MDVICSHCGRTMRTRTSKQPHPDYRKLYLECLNPDCGARARADFVITETLSPAVTRIPTIKKGWPRPSRGDAPTSTDPKAMRKQAVVPTRRRLFVDDPDSLPSFRVIYESAFYNANRSKSSRYLVKLSLS
ncbi:ogr/Delta-like zinc finger family protein [Salinicola tamaricis]|uniref:ogr/Delta-like zinc finger family protein n=1 Tax=Salinicola tamaricis TaxID=1771309 RepID=UPI003BF5B10D